MKRFWVILLALALTLIMCAAVAESKPVVYFDEMYGSMNGGYDYELVIGVNKPQAQDLSVGIVSSDGDTVYTVIPAGQTKASAVIPTEPVTDSVKVTFSFAKSDLYTATATHTLTVVPLPQVKFSSKLYSAQVGREIWVQLYCQNPGAICKQNNIFTLKDQFGNVLAEGEWQRGKQNKEFVFRTTEGMYGHNELTLWLGDQCVTEQSVYTLVGGEKYRENALREVTPELPVMAIGIDCGDGPENIDKVLDVLARHNAKATFFLTGRFIRVYPDAVQKMYDAGHEIATHSESHKHMCDLTLLETYREIVTPIERAEELLGVTPRLFRPPYGEYNWNGLDVCRSEGLEVIRWEPDYHDSLGFYTVDRIMEYATTHYDYHAGSIVLCHLQGDGQPDTLDVGLTYYEERGLRMIPISALLHAAGREFPEMPFHREAMVYTDEYWSTWIEREMPDILG